LRRPLVSNQKLRDFMAAAPMAGDTLVVVFTGTNDTAGMPLFDIRQVSRIAGLQCRLSQRLPAASVFARFEIPR